MSEVLRASVLRLYMVMDGDDAEGCMVLVVAGSSRKAKSLGFKAFMGMFDVDPAELLLGLRVRMQRDDSGDPVVPALPEGVYDGFDETSWMKLGYAAYEGDCACTPQEVADHSAYWCPGWRYDPENARKQLAMMKGGARNDERRRSQ
ncbi:hypothetical protein BPY_23120 [Bifidobacterium psychraerophilum]|uniref:hypothetical protein n=1 Tax=Bifidobacterium psychraerophilum TaxID=218140 RepID=UPI0031172AEF